MNVEAVQAIARTSFGGVRIWGGKLTVAEGVEYFSRRVAFTRDGYGFTLDCYRESKASVVSGLKLREVPGWSSELGQPPESVLREAH